MARKKRNSNINAPILKGFTSLFVRKLQETVSDRNQNHGRRIVIKKRKSVYASEISCMMHTLGDAENPLSNSALYLETILRDQMNLLLIKASEVADSEALTHKPLLTLLAQNKEKMKRLLHYLFLKDSSELLGKQKYDRFADVLNNTQFGIRVNTCLEFLRSIKAEDYDAESIISFADDVSLERVARRFQMSLVMSNQQYFSFSQKQSVCFYPKGDGGKFKKWILDDKVTDLQPTPIALDILAFFARETVAELVEACLQIGRSKTLPTPDSKRPSPLLKNNSHSMEDESEISSDSDEDVNKSSFSDSGMSGLTNFIADCTDSNAEIAALINSGVLGMLDILALSTSSLYEKDTSSGEPRPRKKRKLETIDSFMQREDEESVTGESTSSEETRPRYNEHEPKIPARNRNDPITVEDLKSAVMNLIMSSPLQIHMNKTKKILCL